MGKSVFPKGFLWGASTAGHQVEGNCYDQWTVWELENAKLLAEDAANNKYHDPSRNTPLHTTPRWNAVKKQASKPENYISGEGVAHYSKYQEDFDIAKKINLNAFRFSIEWSRLEPREGEWDEKEFSHYKNYIKELNKRDLEPILNIWHFTLPVWFSDLGGFERRANLKYFTRFVSKIADELLDGINYVITINEPNVYASFGFYIGHWPPEKKSILSLLKVYINLISAHKSAYKVLKAKRDNLQVGIASQMANIQPKHKHKLSDKIVTKIMRYIWNWWFLLRIKNQQDFIGFNYYFSDYYQLKSGMHPADPKKPANDLGWYMEPSGIYPLLLKIWKRTKKPIIVTENGVADEKDKYRQWWIEETIKYIGKAIFEGVEVKGYMHWSLLDNFEWAYGWWPKFGLVEVNRENGMKRTIRPSAKWYADKIKELR